MSNDYSLRFSNAIPFIGQRNYNRNKRQVYEELYSELLSRDPTPEEIRIAKKWELRHTGPTLFNCLFSLGLVNSSMLLLYNSLDKLVNN